MICHGNPWRQHLIHTQCHQYNSNRIKNNTFTCNNDSLIQCYKDKKKSGETCKAANEVLQITEIFHKLRNYIVKSSFTICYSGLSFPSIACEYCIESIFTITNTYFLEVIKRQSRSSNIISRWYLCRSQGSLNQCC